MIDKIKMYNVEAIIVEIENKRFLSEDEANEVFDILLEKTNKLVKACNSGSNSVACLKLRMYKEEIRKILEKYDLGHVFKNRVEKYWK